MRRHRLAVVVLTVSALGLVRCGGSSGSGDLDACTLLTNDEVAAAIGEAVTKTDNGTATTGSAYCHWYGDTSVTLSKGVSIIASKTGGSALYESYKALAKTPTPVSGLGDAAFTDADQGTGVTLYSGSVVLMVTPVYTGTGLTLAACTELAKKALARLQ